LGIAQFANAHHSIVASSAKRMIAASQITEYMMWMFLSPSNYRYTAETKQFVEIWKVY
jgi:hypothetical protein